MGTMMVCVGESGTHTHTHTQHIHNERGTGWWRVARMRGGRDEGGLKEERQGGGWFRMEGRQCGGGGGGRDDALGVTKGPGWGGGVEKQHNELNQRHAQSTDRQQQHMSNGVS